MKRVSVAAMIGLAVGMISVGYAVADTSSAELQFLQGRAAVVGSQCPDPAPARLIAAQESACLLAVRSLIQQREFVAARERVAALQASSLSSEARAALQWALADAYFVEGNWQAARAAYDTAVRQAGRESWAPVALYGLARTTQYLGDLPQARTYFTDVTRQAPWSFEAEAAREILQNEAYLSIQVGSFSDRGNAVRLLKELQGKGYQAYLHELNAPHQVARVRVGRFTSHADAEHMRDELDRLGYSARIAP